MQDYTEITRGLAADGYFVQPDFLSREAVSAVRQEMQVLNESGQFKTAGIGNRHRLKQDESVRKDQIHWLEDSSRTPAQDQILLPLEALRLACNQALFLGLQTLEGHYAVYSPGGFYRRHLDAFHDDDSRVLSVILYLNESWQPGDGGELRLHASTPVTIEPRGGTLVTFLSREMEHEVLDAHVLRRSYAGWYKKRG